MKLLARLFAVTAFWVLISNLAHAVSLPGPELDYMQRIQGDWQRHCYRSVDGDTSVYRRDFLIIGFTQMQFSSKVYLDENCSHERTHYSAIFTYGLVGAYRIADSKKIFPINLTSSDRDALFFDIPPQNISAISEGKLYFGRDFSGESDRSERLSQLDTRNPFLRH